MRRALATTLLACVPALSGARADETTAPESGVRRDAVAGWERLHAVFPGGLVSYALPRTGNGPRQIVGLVRAIEEEPAQGSVPESSHESPHEPSPLALYRVDPSAANGFRLLHDRVPPDVTAIDTVDVDGDGRDELLLARDGELLLLDLAARGEGRIELVLQEPALRWRALHPRAVRTAQLDGWPAVLTHAYSRLDVFGPDDDGPMWKRRTEIDLPLAASVSSTGLRVSSMDPRFIGHAGGHAGGHAAGRAGTGSMLFGTPVERHGQRLHTRLIAIGPDGEAQVTDSWSRLPGPETVLEDHFLMLDDLPVLLVTTKPADKLSLFGEKRLRLFPAQRDLSRLGRRPLFEAETHANLWQEIEPFLVDANRDGRPDLVLGYWKGLTDDRMVLDVYLGSEEGAFERKPRTTAFDVKGGDRSFVGYGHDVDGDDLADLVVRDEEGRLWLYAGRATASGRNVVSSEPSELPLGDARSAVDPQQVTVRVGASISVEISTLARPRFVDLDGDGREELLLVEQGGERRPGRLLVLSRRGGP